MIIALAAAYVVAYPVNRYLLQRGKGHALTHGLHGDGAPVTGPRRFIPALSTSTLAGAIAAFMLGGLLVATADELGWTDDTQDSSVVSH
jgi:hypothetical protein